jgi:hypothetical protein
MLRTVNKLVCCKFCEEILEQPILLPCGETICAKHESLFKIKETARCELCDKDHYLNEADHFPTNKVVEGFLEAEITKLNFGDDYKQASGLLAELNNTKTEYDKIRGDPEDLIHEKFQAMRSKVDIIREQIIQKVNVCSVRIISDINSYENECRVNLVNLDSKLESKKAFDLSGIKADLSDWETKMNKLHYDESLCKEVIGKSTACLKSLQNILNQLKNEILLGEEKKLEFETRYSNIFDTFYKDIGFNK